MPGGRRLSKADRLYEVLGGLDQTSATIGLAISFINDRELTKELQELQRIFLAIGATLAAEKPSAMPLIPKLPSLTKHLENQIDQWDKQLPELNNFILAGGCTGAAALHQARTLSRQTERNYYHLTKTQRIDEIGVYLNRLSDYLFQAARYYNFLQNSPEAVWKYLED